MKKLEKNGFIKQIRKMNEKNDKSEEKAYNKIIENLYIKNLWGKEKAMGLDEYDSEKNSKMTLIPGHIYMFRYLASEKTVPNYNVMAIAKSALETSARYLAVDLGKNNVRVNCLSAGAIKTMAARGISGFDRMLHAGELRSPMGRCVTLDDVGKTGLYLLSDLSSGVTGEVVHVDCGCHSVYNSLAELEAMLK